MKKVLALCIICINLIYPPYAAASTYISKVTVSITDASGTVITDAKVTVTCGTTTITPTYANNLYTGYFGKDKCTQGKEISATAVWNGKTQSTIPYVIPVNEKQSLEIVFGNEPIHTVPEFGLLSGVFAALTSTGTYIAIRKRKR